MKKILKLKVIIFIVILGMSINLLEGCTSISKEITTNTSININEIRNKFTKNEHTVTLNYDDVKDSLIRFHVIANSDNEDDQNLKIKVKNEVIDYLYPYLNKSVSVDESRKIIQDNMENVKKIAEDIIRNNNYDYSVKVELDRENFPDKSYGNIILPQGNYEAFRIIIGSGEGKNWWCVMFPPLCFVDETKAEIEYGKTENKINSKQNVNSEIDNLNEQIEVNATINEKDENYSKNKSAQNIQENKNKIQIKFKIVEIVKSFLK